MKIFTIEKDSHNENFYLYSDQLSIYSENRREMQTKRIEDNNNNPYLICLYEEFIDNVAELIRKMDLERTPAIYTTVLYNLVYNGIFSVTRSYYYDTNLPFELDSHMGLNVVLGKGCCRNITAFHKDVFDTLGEYLKKFYCTAVKNENIDEGHNFQLEHVISLIENNESIIGFDFTTGIFYSFVNEYTLKAENFHGQKYLTYKPLGEYVFEIKELTKKEIYDNLRLFKKESSKLGITTMETVDFWNQASKAIENNHELIRKFLMNNIGLKGQINIEAKKLIKKP